MKKLVVLLLALTVIGVAVVAQNAAAPSVVWHMSVMTGAAVASDSGNSLVPYNYDNESNKSEGQLNATWTSADKNSGLVFRGEMNTNNIPNVVPNDGSANGDFGFRYAYGFTSFANGLVTIQGGRLGVSPINTGWWMNPLDTEGSSAAYFGINPIAGLTIGTVASIPGSNAYAPNQLSSDLYGFNYTMANMFQLVGLYQGSVQGATNTGIIAGGLQLLAVPNLTAKLEIKDTNLGSSANGTNTGSVFKADEQFGYPVGNLALTLYAGEASFTDNGGTSQFQYNIEPSVAYKVSDVTSVGLIANVYSYPSDVVDTFLSPLDGTSFFTGTTVAGQSEATAFGIGPQVRFTQGAGTLVIGDYVGFLPSYASASSSMLNLVYASMNFAL